jgi:hypothetical protein
MPIRSRRSKALARGCVALVATLLAPPALSHAPDTDPLPETPGWRLGAAAALVAPFSDERWPTARWPGVFATGIAPRDQSDGVRLEHATLEAAARLNAWIGVHLAVGWHDREDAHVEAATLHVRSVHGADALQLQAGRAEVRLGPVIDRAGHYDRFSQPPLVKRAIVDDRWIDDGVAIAWRRDHADGLRAVEAGLWRGQAFPGSAAGDPVPSLRVQLGWGPFDAHLTAARFRPEGRGTVAVGAPDSEGHAHGALDCRDSLAQRVCFDGTVDLLAASLAWAPEDGPWSVSAAVMSRHERGSLYSLGGSATSDIRIDGGWIDVAWRAAPRWTLAARAERLVPDNRLEGVGTALLAREAGMVPVGPVERATLALLHDLTASLRLAVEIGEERFEGGHARFVSLRAIWLRPGWLAGAW